jgi:ADP-heptose:LPS heptosyltransferase
MIINLKNRLRKFDAARRRKMNGLENLLYRLISNTRNAKPDLLPVDQVKKVLIARNNKRIGNIIFLIPFVRQVRHIYPNAEIHLMLNSSGEAFFRNMGINKIYYSNFSFDGIAKWFNTIQAANKEHYDVILCPFNSASDSITCAMIESKNKIAPFDSKRSLAFPNAVDISSQRTHAAYSPIALLSGLGYTLATPYNHFFQFSDEELAQGEQQSAQDLNRDNSVLNIAYFRGARGIKLLSNEQWLAILTTFEQQLNRTINWVEILSPDITEPLRANTTTFGTADMRALGCYLANFDGFISCDTGPLHLADASNAACIGLFTHTNPDEFGVIGERCINVTDLETLDPSAIGKQLGW